MESQGMEVLGIIFFIVRIGITLYCTDKAGELNRSKGGWGFFGFMLPIIALIWIQFMKPKFEWDEQAGLDRFQGEHS